MAEDKAAPVKAGEVFDDVPKFSVPVDTEGKAKVIRLLSFQYPHMLCFHVNWLGFFVTFFSAYAAAPLIPIIRDSLGLHQHEANLAGVVTTAGTVFARVFMGSVCDRLGPRFAYATLLVICSIPIFCIALVHNAAGYIIERMLIGCSLAAFVVNQFWSSLLFSPTVVGMANAIGGGWGNAGGGVTQIAMPNLVDALTKSLPEYIAWRYAFFVPAAGQVLIGMCILMFGVDTPHGDYHQLEKTGKKTKSQPMVEMYRAFVNYRTWGLAACYAYSFGVELALDNALAPYFEKNFGFSITKAGNLAAIFGCFNFFARPLGGVFSDLAGRRYGMRGRLWVLFIVLAGGGVGTAVMGALWRSLAGTLIFMCVAAFFLEACCGAVYGVVPFVSRRSTGIVCGLVSAGGAIGGVVNQALFFLNTPAIGAYYIEQRDSFVAMGIITIAVALFGIAPIYFPMWGGLIIGPKPGVTEEDYYFAEYTPAEREKGYHLAASNFAFESRSMRGMSRLAADTMFPVSGARKAKAVEPANGDKAPAAV